MSRRIYLDTESNDGPPAGRIIELGMVEVENGAPTGRTWSRRFRPLSGYVSPHTTRIHGIRYRDLLNEDPFSTHLDDILAFAGGSRIFAHGADSDKIMLNLELRDAGRSPADAGLRFFDTARVARVVLGGGKLNLDAFAAHVLGEAPRKLHGALADALRLARVMERAAPADDADLDLQMSAAGRKAAVARPGPPRFAPPRFIGDGINPGIEELIASVSSRNDLFSLRSKGRDVWASLSGTALDAVLEGLGVARARDPVADMEPHRQDNALRWIGRGLAPDLACAMAREFDRRARSAPSEAEMSHEP